MIPIVIKTGRIYFFKSLAPITRSLEIEEVRRIEQWGAPSKKTLIQAGNRVKATD